MSLTRLYLNFALVLKLSSILLLIGCGSSSINQPSLTQNLNEQKNLEVRKKSYPDWFWNMPHSNGTLYAVGFSEYSSMRPADSEQRAVEDGLKNLAKFLSVHIKVKQKSLLGDNLDILEKDGIGEEISSDIESYVKENYQVIKKFTSLDYTLVLIKLGEKSDSPPENSAGSTEIPKEPLWVTKLPKEPGYIYATGESNLYYREINSWRLAENKARIALAFSVEAKVKGLVKTLDEEMVIISSSSVDTQLNNIQIIARWKNTELNTCHVLVRMAQP